MRKGYIEFCMSLQLVHGPQIMPERKRISRLWSKIEQTREAIWDEYPEESEEYHFLLKRHGLGNMNDTRIQELRGLLGDSFAKIYRQHNALLELIDSFPIVCYLDLHKYMAEDMFAAEFPFDTLVDQFFDANDLLWPDKARLLLDKMDTQKVFYFPDLIPIYFFLRKCAEEHHVIKLIYED